MHARQKLAILGEDFACLYLKKNKYKILERNWRAGKIGEIDIIAEKKNSIIFFEVKTRKSKNYGSGEEAVNFKKQDKISKTALCYLDKNTKKYKEIFFDVIAIDYDEGDFKINHIKNAFSSHL